MRKRPPNPVTDAPVSFRTRRNRPPKAICFRGPVSLYGSVFQNFVNRLVNCVRRQFILPGRADGLPGAARSAEDSPGHRRPAFAAFRSAGYTLYAAHSSVL